MNRYKKMALKALSYCGKNLKKNYRLYRKFTNAVKVCIGHGCRVTDREIIVGDRKIPVRFFYPKNEPTSGILIFFMVADGLPEISNHTPMFAATWQIKPGILLFL
ncbi:esterase/lipase [Acetivibrio straminisolvens JCM 21531]|uniref:Esterase/lipase n=1 Tax=Acetivibrio straminisolvens JCM 21531 TaxID=1294263 RepID=W4V9J9_9FIRM|nr:esterase/lipase [Acetivibrio straminisolvens JCM 21531]